MKEINLTQGMICMVDDYDYDELIKNKWRVRKCGKKYYAVREGKRTYPGRKTIYMHRFILNISDQKIQTDHINSNGLDNRKANLRQCTPSQNNANRLRKEGAKQKYKGILPNHGKWAAYLFYKKNNYLGVFDTQEEAALAYNKKAIEVFGEFAKLNIII